jgi:hypothetical protein
MDGTRAGWGCSAAAPRTTAAARRVRCATPPIVLLSTCAVVLPCLRALRTAALASAWSCSVHGRGRHHAHSAQHVAWVYDRSCPSVHPRVPLAVYGRTWCKLFGSQNTACLQYHKLQVARGFGIRTYDCARSVPRPLPPPREKRVAAMCKAGLPGGGRCTHLRRLPRFARGLPACLPACALLLPCPTCAVSIFGYSLTLLLVYAKGNPWLATSSQFFGGGLPVTALLVRAGERLVWACKQPSRCVWPLAWADMHVER